MDTILSKIILESMVLSGRVKPAEQGWSGNPFKRIKRNSSVDETSPNVVLGSTSSKESTSECNILAKMPRRDPLNCFVLLGPHQCSVDAEIKMKL